VTPVVSATLTTANSTLSAGSAYRYLGISPTVLSPGNYMVVGSDYGGSGTELDANSFWGDPNPILGTGGGLLTFASSSAFSAYTGSPAYPTTPSTGYYIGAGSFIFSPIGPIITTQPTNQTAFVGETATFSVTASGTSPLSYQWSFDTTNILGATNVTLTLTNVQFSQAGNYAVLVTNVAGTVLSSNAALTVTTCDPEPEGLVSWWRAKNNALDSVGTNNGILAPDVTFAPGEVGLGFQLGDTNAYVQVPASSTLNVGTGGGLTLEGTRSANGIRGLVEETVACKCGLSPPEFFLRASLIRAAMPTLFSRHQIQSSRILFNTWR
jgi:hypothetical protein